MFHPSENSLHPYGAYALWAATATRDHKSINQSDFAVSLRSELRRCQLLCGVREPPHTKDPHGPGSEGAGPMPRYSSAAFGHLPRLSPKPGRQKLRPPPSGLMNPYAFTGLNHFTVPIATSVS